MLDLVVDGLAVYELDVVVVIQLVVTVGDHVRAGRSAADGLLAAVDVGVAGIDVEVEVLADGIGGHRVLGNKPDLACDVDEDVGQVGIGVVDAELRIAQAREHLKWRTYSGGRLPVKIAWSAGGVRIWAGDVEEPVASSAPGDGCSGHARAPMHVRETFVGSKIKIYGLKASAGPGSATKGSVLK